MQKIKKILKVFSDNQIIIDSEEIELKNILNGVSGNYLESTNNTKNMSINLYKKNPKIVFEDNCFVLTGNFEYGSKKIFM